MAILFQEEKRIFTLQTKQTTYQMKVDNFGFLLHLYYGAKVSGEMDYLLTYYDRGFSGNPNDVGNNRTYSMDVLPQEYPTLGTGDYRNSAFVLRNHDESACCDLRYAGYEIREGKYAGGVCKARGSSDVGDRIGRCSEQSAGTAVVRCAGR